MKTDTSNTYCWVCLRPAVSTEARAELREIPSDDDWVRRVHVGYIVKYFCEMHTPNSELTETKKVIHLENDS